MDPNVPVDVARSSPVGGASSRGDAVGASAVAVLAAVLTATDLVVLLRYDIDAVWAWLQVPVVVLAWAAPWAWFHQRWPLAGGCLLAMLGGLWGYLYVPPLVALVFAGIAFSRTVRTGR